MQTSNAISKVQANLLDLFQNNLTPGDAYIKFQLTSTTSALLSMEQVQGSLIVDAKNITALPGMPQSVIGMMSSRDRVFCVFDLAQVLKLASWSTPPRQHQIIVLQTNTETQLYVGLAVNQLQGIMRFSNEQIQLSFDKDAANFADLISGVVQQGESTIPILKFDSILSVLNLS